MFKKVYSAGVILYATFSFGKSNKFLIEDVRYLKIDFWRHQLRSKLQAFQVGWSVPLLLQRGFDSTPKIIFQNNHEAPTFFTFLSTSFCFLNVFFKIQFTVYLFKTSMMQIELFDL